MEGTDDFACSLQVLIYLGGTSKSTLDKDLSETVGLDERYWLYPTCQ